MRRAVARGRVFPQSYSTDRRYGRLSLKACALFPLMWANADDQGRLPGEPEEIKYACCPNIDHITKTDIPPLLEELDKNKLIKLYITSKTQAIQMLDWWQVQRLQWAWPSDYPPPEGWQDRLRFKRGAKEVVTINWPLSGETQNGAQVSNQVSKNNSSGETTEMFPLTTFQGKRRGKRRGRGNSPERSGEKSLPSPGTHIQIYGNFVECYEHGWGKKTDGKTLAQMRDFSEELSAAGCPESYVREAFKEAAAANKHKLTYVRAILLDWLGVARGPPG